MTERPRPNANARLFNTICTTCELFIQKESVNSWFTWEICSKDLFLFKVPLNTLKTQLKRMSNALPTRLTCIWHNIINDEEIKAFNKQTEVLQKSLNKESFKLNRLNRILEFLSNMSNHLLAKQSFFGEINYDTLNLSV